MAQRQPGVIYNPGMKDSMRDLAGVLQAAGAYEKERQKRQATEKIMAALASGDETALRSAIEAGNNFQAEYGGGLGGLMQKLGSVFMPGESPGVSALQETGIPIAKTQADLAESRARQGYYSGGHEDLYRQGVNLAQEIAIYESRFADMDPEERAKAMAADPRLQRLYQEQDSLRQRRMTPKPLENQAVVKPEGRQGRTFDPATSGVPAAQPWGADLGVTRGKTVETRPTANPSQLDAQYGNPATGAAAVMAGVGRPRARNDQTGEVIEWDGTKWVPVQ